LLYFMHLRYDRPNLFWSLIPALVVPAFLLCTGIAVLAYRGRNKDH